MKNFLSHAFLVRAFSYAQAHKAVSAIIIIVLAGGGYWTYKTFSSSAGTASYVLGHVEKTTIVASVSASGQVSTVNQIDIKPKASGDVTWVGVKAGDVVRAGQALASIDSTSARQDIADAESSLAAAKLQYRKDSAQAPIDYDKSLETLDEAKKDLTTTYNDTYNTVSNAYLDLPGAVTGMQNILYGYSVGGQGSSQWNIDAFRDVGNETSNVTIRAFADIAERDYNTARGKYDRAVVDFKVLTRYSSADDLEKLLSSSIDTTTAPSAPLAAATW